MDTLGALSDRAQRAVVRRDDGWGQAV